MNEKQCLLQQIYENVKSWLHFAEAKNAALITIDLSIIAILFTSNLSKYNLLLFYISIILLLISLICAVLSFKPINEIKKVSIKNIKENLLHFAYIASLEKEEYIEKLYRYYWGNNNMEIKEVSYIEQHYCQEIIENARITLIKQKFFKLSSVFTFVSVILIIILITFIIVEKYV